MKRYLRRVVYLALISCLLIVGNNAMAEDTRVVLVFDGPGISNSIAKKLRITKQLSSSASGQFSADELRNLLAILPVAKEHIWIIDLRQESHGFINGIPVSWYKAQNRGNERKTPEQIEQEEQQLIAGLAKQKVVLVYTIKKLPAGEFVSDKSEPIGVREAETEQQLVTDLGAHYQRYYVLDHNRPSDAEVDKFIAFVKTQLKPSDWLHFHCRGGKGRSSTFMAMYDMIRNANTTSFNEILTQQADMGNIKLDAMPTKPEKLWKTPELRERYEFLKKFYAYVQDPNGYNVRSWSSWLKTTDISTTSDHTQPPK